MDLVPYIFHEQQEGNLCAQHCLNALLQGPYFTAIDLAELARQLDQKEQDALGNSGSRAASQNMDDSGFFSVQVISHALSIWNSQIIPWGAKEVSDAKAEPEREFSFICNLDQHWYTLRRFGPSTQRWYDLNSLHPQPRYMSATFLGMTLSQLEAEGYSIFVVRPLSKIEAPPVTTPVVPQNKVEAVSTTNLPTESTTVSSAPAPASSFLSERQEMERIRRQRIEERERVGKQQTSSSSTSPATPAVSDTIDQNSSNKRIRVDPAEETKQPSKDVLVDTSSFLPACEADAMAAAMPLVQSSESKKAEDQTFGGTGYRLGGSPPRSNSGDSSLPPGFSLEDTDLADTEDADWEMMQQAIAMSLQSSK